MNIVIQLNILSEDEVDFKGGNSVFQLLLGSFYHCKNCIVNGVLWYQRLLHHCPSQGPIAPLFTAVTLHWSNSACGASWRTVLARDLSPQLAAGAQDGQDVKQAVGCKVALGTKLTLAQVLNHSSFVVISLHSSHGPLDDLPTPVQHHLVVKSL